MFPIGDQNEPGGRRAPITLVIILLNFVWMAFVYLFEPGLR